MVLKDENLAQAKGCLQKKKKKKKKKLAILSLFFGAYWSVTFFSFFFPLNNLFNKMGIRKGKGNLYNANWPLGARTD